MHPAAEKIRGKTLHVILEKFFIMSTSSLYTAYRLTITDCQNDVLIFIVYIHHIEPVISENLGFFALNFLAIFLPIFTHTYGIFEVFFIEIILALTFPGCGFSR